MEINDKRIADLKEIVKIQCSNGNWNCNEYMHGMANGLLLAEQILLGDANELPKYLEAPAKWLKDSRVQVLTTSDKPSK